MKCNRVALRLERYYDEALTPSEFSKVHAHLGACAACQNAFARVKTMHKTLSAMPRKTVTPEMSERLYWRTVSARHAEEAKKEKRKGIILRDVIPGLLSAAALAMFAFGVGYMNAHRPIPANTMLTSDLSITETYYASHDEPMREYLAMYVSQ